MAPIYARDPTSGVSGLQEKGRITRATNIPGRNVSMAPRNIQMAAMDSPVFDYVVFYFLLNNLHVGQ